MAKQPQCGEECYTKGRGCVLSQDGRCMHLFSHDVEKPQTIKSFTADYMKTKTDERKAAKSKSKS